MIRLLTYLFFVSFSGNLIAQSAITLHQYNNDSNKVLIGSIAEVQYNSSSITNQFANNFYQGKYITNEIKAATSSRLTSGNFLGADINYGLYSSVKLNSFLGRNPYQLNWFIGAFNRQHFDASVPENLFKLIFEGNKQFAGKTVDAGGLSLNLLQYQQIQTGFLYDNGLGQAFAFSVSYLNGNRHLSYQVHQLDLYTSEIGDELNLNWNMNYQRSNLDSNQFVYPNGYGFSTDLMYIFNYSSNQNDNNYFKLEVNDLGFINWSQQSTTISSIDSMNYTGYHIPDIQNIQDSIISVDSIIDRFTHTKNGSYTSYLPTQVSMSLRQQHSKKLAMHLGIRYRINANYRPYLYVEEHYSLNENIDLGGRISYGGYSRLSFGINVNARFNHFNIVAGTNNLEGLILPKQLGGFSTFMGLTAQF